MPFGQALATDIVSTGVWITKCRDLITNASHSGPPPGRPTPSSTAPPRLCTGLSTPAPEPALRDRNARRACLVAEYRQRRRDRRRAPFAVIVPEPHPSLRPARPAQASPPPRSRTAGRFFADLSDPSSGAGLAPGSWQAIALTKTREPSGSAPGHSLCITVPNSGRCPRSGRWTCSCINVPNSGRCPRSGRCTFLCINVPNSGRCPRSGRWTF